MPLDFQALVMLDWPTMSKSEPLSKAELGASLKASGFATHDDMREIVEQATDAILQGMEELYKKLSSRLDVLADELQIIKSQVGDLQLDTPSRREFEALKARVKEAATPAN